MKTQRTLLNARALVAAKTDDVSSASIRSFSCWGREYVKTAEVIDDHLFSPNLLPRKKRQTGKAEKGEERARSKIAAVRIHVR